MSADPSPDRRGAGAITSSRAAVVPEGQLSQPLPPPLPRGYG